MKRKILLLLFLTALVRHTFAQSVSVQFEITVADPNSITGYTSGGIPVFSNPAINSIIAGYTVSTFSHSNPESRMKYVKEKRFKVICNSVSLAADLHSADAALFPNYQLINEGQVTFTPDDWNLAIAGASDYLDYINGREAWDITHGDPSVVIGALDLFVQTSHRDFYKTLPGGAPGASKINVISPNYFTADHHGTAVASMIAAATDNGVGLPAIGFDCQLDLSTDWSTNKMMEMSKRGVRIINCSWVKDCDAEPTLNLRNHFWNQGYYNEIYENGTLMCFGAGNGVSGPCTSTPATDYYFFPAAYDHVFSTTSIGWKNAKGPGVQNAIGIHELTLGNPRSTYTHNDRVDICAPTYVGAARWNPSDSPPKEYYDVASGTSSSTPLVAGTAGLIQSALKQKEYPKYMNANYSPYQLEYILKKSANPDIFGLAENAPYLGQLGAGRLDAKRAVDYVVGFPTIPEGLSPNDPTTQTMFIQGVDINTICVPGYSSSGVLPKLTPVILNGTPPYTYVWEAVPDGTNTALLDNENIAEPTITGIKSGASTYVLHYRLTVYDNSEIQKVAMRTFKIQLKTSGYDLAIRDSYMDMFNERNDQIDLDPRESDPYRSPDLWNRQTADGIQVHEQPEYFTTLPNYAYVRVRNIGCASSPSTSKLKLYWTKASTGENWDADWKYTNVCGIGALMPGGREITSPTGISIPVISAGSVQIINHSWYPPKPQDYCDAPEKVNVCLLARIEDAPFFDSDGSHPLGMKINEKMGEDVITNVWNNNNIATRNMWLTDLNPFNRRTERTHLIVANGNANATTFNFEFASDRSVFRHFAGDFSSLGSVTLYLGDLYDNWVNAGGLGTVASQNAQARSVTFDGANTLRLEEIPFAANERYTIEVEFTLDSPVIVNETSTHTFFVRQYRSDAPETIYGGGDYVVTVSPGNPHLKQTKELIDSAGASGHSFQISPNPTTDLVQIKYTGCQSEEMDVQISDISGRILKKESVNFKHGVPHTLFLSDCATGIYMVTIDNHKNIKETYKVIKK